MIPPPWRILWVKAGALHPPDTGGKIRTLSMLREQMMVWMDEQARKPLAQ